MGSYVGREAVRKSTKPLAMAGVLVGVVGASLYGVSAAQADRQDRANGEANRSQSAAQTPGVWSYDLTTVGIAPAAPEQVRVVPGKDSAEISWEPPSSSAAYPPAGYFVLLSPGGKNCQVNAPATTCKITGLTNGTSYTAVVQAYNPAGASSFSSSSQPFTPRGR